VTYRVWLRRGDVCWWEPVEADSEEGARKALSRSKRKLVTRVDKIEHEPAELRAPRKGRR